MDTLHNMRVFVRVVEGGTFTAAARHLNSTTAHVSRAISDLETHLRARLLNRTTRRIALTSAGERYLNRCQQILAYVDEAEAEAGDAHARPAGSLRVHAMGGFGQHYVIPAMARFRREYPEVQIELTLGQRMPDMLEEGYDVAITLARELPDSGLISHGAGACFSVACAAPSYLATHAAPRLPAELAQHDCLQLVNAVLPFDTWLFDGPDGQTTVPVGHPVFKVNLPEAMLGAIREGMGVGPLPVYSALDGLRSGALVRVLPQYRLHQVNAFMLYPSRRYLDAKIRTFVAFLRDVLPGALAIDLTELAALS